MLGNLPFEKLYDSLILEPSIAYRATLGPPVHISPEALQAFLVKLKDFRETSLSMAFWLVIDFKHLTITHSDGDDEIFGRKLKTAKDFYRLVHPDYFLPYLRWRGAAYESIYKGSVSIDPLEVDFRVTIPLETAENQYYWFNINSTILQVDAENRIVTNLQTFYRESKWSARTMRPLEASVQIRKTTNKDLESRLIAQLSLQMIDEFTDAELDLLSLYAAGKPADAVMATKGWSRHTLHEYNANLLRKAKALFVYDFRNAREFAEYAQEKGIIRIR